MIFFQINAELTNIQMLPVISFVILKQNAESLGLFLSTQLLKRDWGDGRQRRMVHFHTDFYSKKAKFLDPYISMWKYCISTIFDREQPKVMHQSSCSAKETWAEHCRHACQAGGVPSGHRAFCQLTQLFPTCKYLCLAFCRCSYAVSSLLFCTCT